MIWMITISDLQRESLRLHLVGRCQYDVVCCYVTCRHSYVKSINLNIPQLYFMQLFNY